jgi:hypothetical protein
VVLWFVFVSDRSGSSFFVRGSSFVTVPSAANCQLTTANDLEFPVDDAYDNMVASPISASLFTQEGL